MDASNAGAEKVNKFPAWSPATTSFFIGENVKQSCKKINLIFFFVFFGK